MLLADWGARTHNSIGVSPGEPSMHLRWNDMRRDEALRLLAAHREEIARFGVKSLAIFGSVARDEAGPDSDVDVLVEFSVPVGLSHFWGSSITSKMCLVAEWTWRPRTPSETACAIRY